MAEVLYQKIALLWVQIQEQMAQLQEEINKYPITVTTKLDAGTAGVPGTDTDKYQKTKKEGEGDREAEHRKKIQQNLGRISDVGVSFIQRTFGMVEQLYAQLKKSSPLLQAIEQLFNLAWTLFFMPIGNKLGEMLIPSVIQLMDDVMEIWDAFEGMSISEMLSYAITEGATMLGDFILDIADKLDDQGGLIGAIGDMLHLMGDFIKNHGAQLITFLTRVMEFVLSHLKEIISVIVAFKAASMVMQVQQIIATYAANTWDNFISGGLTGALKATAIAGIIGAMAGGTAYGIMSFAEGGHVNATPGGQLAIIGEGGEGETIIPDSKLGSIGGTNNYYLTVQSFSPDETERMVTGIVNNKISEARLRSGL